MGTEKRERQRRARQERIEQEQRAAEGARRRRIGLTVGAVVVVVLGVIAAMGVLSDDDGDEAEPAPVTTAAPDPPDAEEGADAESDAEALEVFANDECPPEDGSGPQQLRFAQPPPTCIDESATYRATMATSAGEIVVELDPSLDPVSVNNFVVLARHGYYDGVTFHRVIDGFVIQGGDPVGDPPGTGSPGYTLTGGTPEVPDDAATAYEVGDLAVANRGDPSTNGAQFFIVTGPQGEALPPLYSKLGTVVEGLDVALGIQAVETDPTTDRPLDDVVVESVRIEEVAPGS